MIVFVILVGSARFFLHFVIYASRSVGSFAVNAAMRLAIGSSWYSKKVWRSDSRVARRVIFVNNCALSAYAKITSVAWLSKRVAKRYTRCGYLTHSIRNGHHSIHPIPRWTGHQSHPDKSV